MTEEPDCRTRLYDSLTRRQVPLPQSRDPERPGGRLLNLYVCGVTPYDSGHLGHAFTFCAFDVLVRWVEACGARAWTSARAKAHMDTALGSLNRVRMNPIALRELSDLAAFVVERES